MNVRSVVILVTVGIALAAITACDGLPPASTPLPLPTAAPGTIPQVTSPASPPATAANATAQPAQPTGSAGTPVKSVLSCPPVQPLAASVPVAARVNGQGVPLDLYLRQVAQAQAAFIQQGIDPKSQGGQEALQSLKQQVLDQMINDLVISQQAEKEGIRLTDSDLDARLAQMIQDAGSVDKLNQYLAQNQLTLVDFCSQIRLNVLGEAMLNRVTAALPTNVEQVHLRQILVATSQQAQDILKQLRAGGDFASLAKKYSVDEASKANGGDLGWAPKGRFDSNLEAIAFQLKPGQTSDVIQTQYGYHIIRLEERDGSRALPPGQIQEARQRAFLAWLQAVRSGMKIEQLVQP